MARTRDRRVKGLLLLGPVSDVAAEMKQIGRRELARRVAVVERLARRDPNALVPREFGFWSARRYLSLYRPGGAEDVFPYYRRGARWSALGNIRIPIAAVLGGRDEFLDRPAAEVLAALARHATRARSYTGIAIPGALHGFRGHERALATEIVRWVERRCVRGPRPRRGR
jgi:pimeloyl-ACP methyl ester carboxylesterase